MLGAIIGDMVGSVYEFSPIKTKDFNIINMLSHMTDDSLLTLSVVRVLMKHYPIDYSKESLELIKEDLIKGFFTTWRSHPDAGYGRSFFDWCLSVEKGNAKPYNSYGNGAAMRISPVGWVAQNEKEVKLLSKTVTEITHNHPEGLKGAEAISMCIYLALHGYTKEQIKERMICEYYPEIEDLNYEELVKSYYFSPTCQKSVPQAIYCFLISTSVEDAIRNCISIGGDCDTTGAMAGSIAEAFYQKDVISPFEKKFIYLKIEPYVVKILKEFYNMLGNNKLDNMN